MNDIFVQDIVYDTVAHCFMNMMYSSKEKADSTILDSIGFLPIRESEDRSSVNIYKVKGENKIVKIRYYRADFKSIKEYRDYIIKVLAEHNRSLDDLVLVKKIVDKGLYSKIGKLASSRKKTKLLCSYGWM